MAVAPLGFVGWLVYSWRQAGTPLAFLKAEQFWGYSHFMWFMTPVISLAHLLTSIHAFARLAARLGQRGHAFRHDRHRPVVERPTRGDVDSELLVGVHHRQRAWAP